MSEAAAAPDSAAAPAAETPIGNASDATQLVSQAEGGAPAAQNSDGQAPAATTGDDTPEVVTPEQQAKREGRRFERKLGNAIRREAEARARADQFERQLNEMRQAQPAAQVDPGEPRLEQFDDVDKFREAVKKYGFEQGQKEVATKQQAEARLRAQHELVASWEKKVDAGSNKYDDFDEKVGELKPGSPLTHAIMEADNGDDIAYYLGTHLDEAAKIVQMSPTAQIRAIGRLESKLAAEPPKQQKPPALPAPIKPVGSKAGGAANDMPQDSDDINTWMRKEHARERKLRESRQ